ncbi:hypothetical protein HMPREF1551_01738 [Capnocytophaga sp. oral taxon 863 str. F0517]|nr:hypothetical protein HMPREF1551_01738 [Capnocytophaga sp. oral taxon 863 str. F0517]
MVKLCTKSSAKIGNNFQIIKDNFKFFIDLITQSIQPIDNQFV